MKRMKKDMISESVECGKDVWGNDTFMKWKFFDYAESEEEEESMKQHGGESESKRLFDFLIDDF